MPITNKEEGGDDMALEGDERVAGDVQFICEETNCFLSRGREYHSENCRCWYRHDDFDPDDFIAGGLPLPDPKECF